MQSMKSSSLMLHSLNNSLISQDFVSSISGSSKQSKVISSLQLSSSPPLFSELPPEGSQPLGSSHVSSSSQFLPSSSGQSDPPPPLSSSGQISTSYDRNLLAYLSIQPNPLFKGGIRNKNHCFLQSSPLFNLISNSVFIPYYFTHSAVCRTLRRYKITLIIA
jgi:hypothetical protein